MQSLFRSNRKPTQTTHLTHLRALYWHTYIASSAAHHHYKQYPPLEALRLERAYAKKPQTGLWWWTATEAKLSDKGFIRHHFTKRVRRAFVHVLREKGFAEDGAPILVGVGGGKTGEEGLKGCLQLMLSAGARTVTDEALRRECTMIVEKILLPENTRAWKRIVPSSGVRRTSSSSSSSPRKGMMASLKLRSKESPAFDTPGPASRRLVPVT